MSTTILAVSGGVDSTVMLDFACKAKRYSSGDIISVEGADFWAKMAVFWKNYAFGDIIVAHFDHGIRENSKEDAEFVRGKAAEYGLKFETKRAELGEKASEEEARKARYDFLEKVAQKYSSDGQPAEIWTAHHLDDLVETVAINFVRGTGWRGLAGLDQAGVRRPFLEMAWTKADIMRYAAENQLCWREDQTNSSDEYLRNRLRERMELTREQKMEIYRLWCRQKAVRHEIDGLVQELLPKDNTWQRSWFRDLDAGIAIELLRAGTMSAGVSATRSQLENFRQAILNYAPGKKFNLPGDRLVKLERESFRLLNKK